MLETSPMLEPAHLKFSPDGTPWSDVYGDIYHSSSGGPDQARHVFLGGNQLPRRWQDKERFVILETGFGLGLNFLTTWAAFRQNPGTCTRLHFVSVEKHPFHSHDLRQAQAAWPEFAPFSEALLQQWPLLTPGIHRLFLDEGRVVLTLVFGDAREKLRRLELRADAFYLDGFSPAKNPELWDEDICRAIARIAAPGATLATWSVSGSLREALKANEFSLEKQPGFAEKREMLVGHYQSRKPNPYPAPTHRRTLVIGAGVAGTSIANALAGRNWDVEVLERGSGPGQGASGNQAGVFRPLPSVDDNYLFRLTRAGFLAARTHLENLAAKGHPVRWGKTGALHLARDNEHELAQARAVETLGLPPEFIQYLNQEEASALLGWPTAHGGWYFPEGGWVQPPSLCHANLQAFPERIHTRYDCSVADIRYQDGEWHALDAQGKTLAAAPHLVMASGIEAPRFSPFAWLPQRPARGQTSLIPECAIPPLKMLVCGQGYITPAVDGLRVAGASFEMDDLETDIRTKERQENINKINTMLPGLIPDIVQDTLSGRVGFRPMSPDRLPIVGPMPEASSETGTRKMRHVPALPGLWCMQGFGTRGIVWSALMADFLASRMEGEPLPLENDLIRAISPERFLPRLSHATEVLPEFPVEE